MDSKQIAIGAARVTLLSLVMGLCFVAGLAVSGLGKIAPPTSAPAPAETPAHLAWALLVFMFATGLSTWFVLSLSRAQGWKLTGPLFLALYGIMTVASQIDSIFFLQTKLPPGMIGAILLQGAISAALFAPAAVWIVRKRRAVEIDASNQRRNAVMTFWSMKTLFLVAAFVFLYMFFGYYIAWQNPELRNYYGGRAAGSFFDALADTWRNTPALYPVQMLRGGFVIAVLLPLLGTLRGTRLQLAVATALFMAAPCTQLLIPNALMPENVRLSHLCETLAFSVVFGALFGWQVKNREHDLARPSQD